MARLVTFANYERVWQAHMVGGGLVGLAAGAQSIRHPSYPERVACSFGGCLVGASVGFFVGAVWPVWLLAVPAAGAASLKAAHER